MFINLNKINEKGIIIDQEVKFEEDIYKNNLILGIEDAYVKGKIYYSTSKEVIFDGNIKGNMLLNDSNTNEIVKYPFKCEINEILSEDNSFSENLRTKEQNSLDLKEVLWENIVLEVPLSFSLVDKPNVTKGEGWELINEDKKKEDPRLQGFKDLLNNGKE